MTKTDTLEQQILSARLTISADGYPMSIGELTSLYRNGELIIRPEFQRFFRWSDLQKSRLIESLLLGIPIPSIFVAQTDTGTWELVDGLQRVATILEMQGELIGEDKKLKPPLRLQGTKYLPALEGRSWLSDAPATALTEAQKLDLKRSRIDIKIIKRDSSAQTKFDLFERLNNYGSPLNAAEMRSALLVAVSPPFFAWAEELSRYPSFVECTSLSDRLIEERYDLELVTRFIVLHRMASEKLTLTALRDFSHVLDEASIELASQYPTGMPDVAETFKTTFDVILENGGDLVFRRWDESKQEFKGSFLNTSFEVFALGLGYHISSRSKYKTDLIPLVKGLWKKMPKGYATGRSTEARLVEYVPLGRDLTAA